MISSLDLFLVICALAAIAVLQFFKGRRHNLVLLKIAAETLEKVFNPIDKVYRIVGIYVGFQAVYWLRDKHVDHAEATVLLLPRYSAFYYPISKALNRFDKLFITFWYPKKTVFDEIHVVRHGAYRRSLRKVIKDLEHMTVSETVVKGVRFVIASRGRSSQLKKVVKFLEELSDPSKILHVALVPQNNSIYLYAVYDPKMIEELASKSLSLAKSIG